MPEQSIEDLRERVGERYTVAERFPVEAGKIAEFADAVAQDDSVFFDTTGDAAVERGFEDVPAPPTFTMAVAFFERWQDAEGRPDIGFDRSRSLHGEQSFEYLDTPIVAGDVLSAQGELTDVYQRDGSRGTMTFAEFTTTFRNQDDDEVLKSTMTLIETPGEKA